MLINYFDNSSMLTTYQKKKKKKEKNRLGNNRIDGNIGF